MRNPKQKAFAWIFLAAIVLVTIVPIDLRPGDFISTDIDRACAFALLSALMVTAYPSRWRWALAVTLFGPSMIELLQFLSPTRHAHVSDALVKTAGGLCGFAAALLFIGLAKEFKAAGRKRRNVERPVELTDLIDPALVQYPVKSKLIQSIHFSPDNGRLMLSFNDGRTRVFDGVAETHVEEMANAASPGRYYAQEFKQKYRRAA